ncbi:hypothetical protein NUW54_g12342 [Trametes sanguinea]|uniref:Uncharacterized protein n=1 Tax=Trametes sanguinea TaxID=158606 RepID=A0ACC1MYN5_9APHY|nr:hypothetical protein NUW54_g12342 [Trametes sanguinea]
MNVGAPTLTPGAVLAVWDPDFTHSELHLCLSIARTDLNVFSMSEVRVGLESTARRARTPGAKSFRPIHPDSAFNTGTHSREDPELPSTWYFPASHCCPSPSERTEVKWRRVNTLRRCAITGQCERMLAGKLERDALRVLMQPVGGRPTKPSSRGDLFSSVPPVMDGAVKKPEKKRQQRSDVKRHHARRLKSLTADSLPVVRPYPLPPKRGITSFRFVLPESSQVQLVGEDSEGPGYFLVNDPVDEFSPDSAPGAYGRSRSVLEDDPISEFLPEEALGGGMEVDEIEDADGDWPGL